MRKQNKKYKIDTGRPTQKCFIQHFQYLVAWLPQEEFHPKIRRIKQVQNNNITNVDRDQTNFHETVLKQFLPPRNYTLSEHCSHFCNYNWLAIQFK